MDIPSKVVHEMFYSFHHSGTRLAAISQITDQAGVVCGKAAESGRGHARVAKEILDLAEQHLS
ncbi:MAG: hypothetical protein ACO1OX_00895 [Novosphingobium sp.]